MKTPSKTRVIAQIKLLSRNYGKDLTARSLPETGEIVLRSPSLAPTGYFTNDPQDALDTACHMMQIPVPSFPFTPTL